MEIQPIRDDNNYQAALKRIEEIWKALPGTPEDAELEILTSLVETYEKNCYPPELPDPIEAIKIRMEDLGLERKDLENVIGSKGRISEILNRRRPLTLPMVQRLSEKLGLPVEVLAQTYPLDRPTQRKCRSRHGKDREACV
jgi:HTH-type transcriptional regulator / antitoxin HigA